MVSFLDLLWGNNHEIAFLEVNFAERVRKFAEEDESFSSTEKVEASEGHRNVLRLLYQLCPGAAPKSQPAPCKACDFEGLYAPSDAAPVAEGSSTIFNRVAELREEHQARFRAAAEAGKAVASAFPSRCRDRGCCSDPTIESSTPMNPSIPRLVGALSSRRSLNFSFEEAARVESLCNGMLAAQSSGFWFFSALLHSLKELGFEAPDPGLFGQLVQEVWFPGGCSQFSFWTGCVHACQEGKVCSRTSLRMWVPISRRILMLLLLMVHMSLTTRC